MKDLNNHIQAFFKSNSDMYWIRDADFKTLLYISPACSNLLDLTPDVLYKDSFAWLDKLHGEDKFEMTKEMGRFLKSPHEIVSNCYAYRIIGKHGNVKKIHDGCYPLHDDSGKLFGFAGVARDVTQDAKDLTEHQRASHFFHIFAAKFRAVFWVYDADRNAQVYLSPGFEKIWGRSREEFYTNPKAWLHTLHPEDWGVGTGIARFRRKGGSSLSSENEYECRYRIVLPSGEVRWIKDTSFQLHDGGSTFVGFAEDITKEVLHKQELKEAIKRAEVANQVKSDFLAMVSHELRTPLNAIIGMAQILKTKQLPAELKEYVDIIQHAGNGLLSLVNDILDFARLEAGKLTFDFATFDLKILLEQVITSMQYLAQEKKISLTLFSDDLTHTYVTGDADRVRQIIINLISNAIKFTDHGFVYVTVLQENMFAGKTFFSIAVKDSGKGIASDQIKHIFKRFNQVDAVYKRKHGGMGLGLSISKELAVAMGGDITVTSQIGLGSTFRCSLPFTINHRQAEQGANQHIDHPKQVLPQFPFHVLIVEDNLINQKIARHMLEDFGCAVTVFSSGEEVFADISHLKNYDLFFVDIGLPDISGFEIAAHLKQIRALANIPIIAMTAHVLDQDKLLAKQVGMNRMIAKPITYDELRQVLETHHVANLCIEKS